MAKSIEIVHHSLLLVADGSAYSLEDTIHSNPWPALFGAAGGEVLSSGQ